MPDIGKIRSALLRWYKTCGRDLPWRRTRDPYRIWVSEVMLQQTRVETVIDYYHCFLEAFPAVTALAVADLEAVLKIWEGMGYYARARNLHRGAQAVVEKWDGELPRNLPDLLRVPGIGRSTAGAILSLAFEIPTPVLDGNVKRVVARLFALRGDLKRPALEKKLWRYSELLTPKGRVHHYTQAVMDLGAILCTPRRPNCPHCPLQNECRAFRLQLQEKIPAPSKKRSLPHHHVALGVIRKRGRILIYRRPVEGLLGGLWGFPNYRSRTKKGLSEALGQGVRKDYGIRIESGKPVGSLSHGYTHFTVTFHLFDCSCRDGEKIVKRAFPTKWVYPRDLRDYPLSASDRKVIRKLSAISYQQ
ncbi:MAG: A/G-specific adenine glycosylase [Deltaproteobacteria bacterium]|nr:A/G-specific adenine glycosylase [Deltaproteobacteria bacterium]